VYLPFARRKYPGPSPRVIGPGTAAVIDGYTRCASTFAVYAFQLAQPRPVPLAHHLHAPAQLIEAARRALPTLVVTREPKGAILSQLVREPRVDLLDALNAYRRFHRVLLHYRDAFVVGEFKEVTSDFGEVVRKMNVKFDRSFGVFGGTEDEVAECRRLIELRSTLAPVQLAFESGETTYEELREYLSRVQGRPGGTTDWVPSASRQAAKAALEDRWWSRDVARARERAEEAYAEFRGGS
jgi:hypothetical protein